MIAGCQRSDPGQGGGTILSGRSGRCSLPLATIQAGTASNLLIPSRRLLQTHRILWCELFEEGNEEPDYDPAIESMVLHTLPANRFVDPAPIVLELNLIVWDADKALPRLVARGTRVKILILKGHVSAACPQM